MKIREAYELKQIGDHYLVTRKTGERPAILFALNETGAFLWKELARGKTEAQMTESLCGEYEAGPEEEAMIRRDVADFLEQLRGVGALVETDDESLGK